MEVDCNNCGSICDVRFEEEQTTEDHPLFCPFCGECVDEPYPDEEDENHDYLTEMLEQDLSEDNPEDWE